MSNYTESNPPAFPRDHRHVGHNGMSLRDWFAGQVLYGLRGIPVDAPESESVARRCYMMADAMLAARTLTPESSGEKG